MNVAVTGANGFIGKNLISRLQTIDGLFVVPINKDMTFESLTNSISEIDFVFHLAGVNRPIETQEFFSGNVEYTQYLVSTLKGLPKPPSIVFASSTQAELANDYGESKRLAEQVLLEYAKDSGAKIFIYRLSNVFGKWSRPNYNSAVATFCHNIANNIPITIHDFDSMIELVYIDDVIEAYVTTMNQRTIVSLATYQKSVGDIATIIQSFRHLQIGDYSTQLIDPFIKKLYSTYTSFIPIESLVSQFLTHKNERGSFTEFARNEDFGQFSINVSKPGIIKGNHWHQTKHEKFIVVQGTAVIRLRQVFDTKVHEIKVSSDVFSVVDIPSGYVHHIENIGEGDLITIMWASELFTDQHPDTYPMEVFV